MSIASLADKLPELSDDVQEIITTKPTWIVGYGSSLLAVLFILVVSGALLFPYQQTIQTSLKIITINAPKAVVAKMDGKIVQVLTKEGAIVKAGQPLAYLQSTASHTEVQRLLGLLSRANGSFDALKLELPNIRADSLGELQSDFEIFYNAFLAFKASNKNGLHQNQQAILSSDLINLQKKKSEQEELQKVYQKDLSIAVDRYRVHSKLTEAKVESPMELKDEESKYLSKQAQAISNNLLIISIDDEIKSKQNEILEISTVNGESGIKFQQQENTLKSKIDKWKENYILTSPLSGKLDFAGFIQAQQEVSVGKAIFYVEPQDTRYVGELQIPQDNAGRIKLGQTVIIKLKGYPYQDFGILSGNIDYISNLPVNDNNFLARVSLKDQHQTDTRQQLYLKNGLSADAEIIVTTSSFLQSWLAKIEYRH